MGAIGHALGLAGSMTWEILWALILGFALSAVVQAGGVLLAVGATASPRMPLQPLAAVMNP